MRSLLKEISKMAVNRDVGEEKLAVSIHSVRQIITRTERVPLRSVLYPATKARAFLCNSEQAHRARSTLEGTPWLMIAKHFALPSTAGITLDWIENKDAS